MATPPVHDTPTTRPPQAPTGSYPLSGIPEYLAVGLKPHVEELPSRSEGGANVITEAFALGTPILASKIPGNTGLLGEQHPGLFRPGDAEDLARLMLQVESEPGFGEQLSRLSSLIPPKVAPPLAQPAVSVSTVIGIGTLIIFIYRGRGTEGRQRKEEERRRMRSEGG